MSWILAATAITSTTTTTPPPIHVTINQSDSPLAVVSIVIALLALAVSILRSRADSKEQRRHHPNVEATATFVSNLISGKFSGKAIVLSISNTGLEPTTVEFVLLTTDHSGVNGQHKVIDGPPIPHRLDGHSGESWGIDAGLIDVPNVTIAVTLGHGLVLLGNCHLDDSSHTRLNPAKGDSAGFLSLFRTD